MGSRGQSVHDNRSTTSIGCKLSVSRSQRGASRGERCRPVAPLPKSLNGVVSSAVCLLEQTEQQRASSVLICSNIARSLQPWARVFLNSFTIASARVDHPGSYLARPQVADLIVASGTEEQLEGHRREITALFCDLRGFTGFTESADAEDVMALLRDYHAAIGEIIIKYSGTLERYAGDGVMVIFNDPVPVENPALQAVLAALDMRAAIGALTEKWS